MYVTSVVGYAKLLRNRRQHLGISQETMAESLGVSRRWLVDFENGKVPNPGFATILSALHIVGLTLDVQQTVTLDHIAEEFADRAAIADCAATAATKTSRPSSKVSGSANGASRMSLQDGGE